VETHGPLSSVLTAALGAILAEALSAVHTQGLLHRDLKPANILLGPNGPKIIDFGLAAFAESSVSLTAPNQVVGTPVCMAPEQAAGAKPLTPAVDVYALGAVLLFAAAGHYPHQAATPYMVFHLVTDPDAAPDLSDAPADLVPLLTDMLAHRAQDRPPLVEVVQRCRSVVEAHGLKIAQARRRLTAHTARQHTPAVPPPAPAPPPAVPFAHLPAATASAAQEPAPTADAVVPTPTLPVPPAVTETPETQAPATSAHGDTSEGTHGDRSTPSRPAKSPQHRAEPSRTLRHSVQARRTAERIRAAYAAGAPFVPSRTS
jgi:serine/threonine protein kinase